MTSRPDLEHRYRELVSAELPAAARREGAGTVRALDAQSLAWRGRAAESPPEEHDLRA